MANVIGNTIVGRYADHYTIPIMMLGLITLSAPLILLALLTQYAALSVILFIVISLVGVPMNPAMITRVMKTATHPGPLVNTIHTSVINIGLEVGSWVGGLGISAGHRSGSASPLPS